MSSALTILHISDDVILDILDMLDPVSLAQVHASCRQLHALSSRSSLWARHLRVFTGEREVLGADPDCIPSCELFGRLFRPRTRGWHCDHCGDTLMPQHPLTQGFRQRCPCICRRVKMPLEMFSFAASRCGSSCLNSGFQDMANDLKEHFDFALRLSFRLPENLSDTDLVILCTTEAPELSDTEQSSLIAFVRAGGTAILTAFSNWSRFGHFNRKLVEWLGVDVQPGSFLEGRSTVVPDLPTHPWGCEPHLSNKGESHFVLDGEERTCAFFPRGHRKTHAGQVFVCSNYHWLADEAKWMGGLYNDGDNRSLLLNLAADAASRRCH